MAEYCKKCKSRLYPVDTEYIKKYGVCSYCVTYSNIKKRNKSCQNVNPVTEKVTST